MNLEDTEHIRALFQKYLKGQCSRQETEQLMAYFGQDKLPELLRDFIKEELHNESKPESEALKRVRAYSDRVGEHLRREINPHIKTSTRIVHRRLSGKWHAFAAAILLLVVAGVSWMYIGRSFKGVPEVVSNARYGNDVSPGSNRAILTLANGNKIDLDSAVTGTLVTLKGINIVKKETGLISYEAEKRDDHAWKPEYNTITTPRGGQYQLILPDGSRVWLNAASSLRFPARFEDDERMVELTGEAYFEVAHQPHRPFTVKSKGQSVHVLGTEFNINAYPNEATAGTTLVKGSIRIRKPGSGTARTLKPGQQALLYPDSFLVKTVNTEEYTAWKNGDFRFNEADLHYILRQMERWYDIEVDYRNIPHLKLSAAISRDKKLSGILYMIEQASGLVFTLEERRLSLSL